MPVWVNRLTTIRVNELEVDDLQNLINEVRGYLWYGNNSRHQWRPGRFPHLGEQQLLHARGPFDESKPRTLRRTQIM